MLFSAKSGKSSVSHQIKDIDSILNNKEQPRPKIEIKSAFETLTLKNICPKIPETPVLTTDISLKIKKGEWAALYGVTGKGKTTLLNSLFYPEYRHQGDLIWNGSAEISHLPVPEGIYVTQKAFVGTDIAQKTTFVENYKFIVKIKLKIRWQQAVAIIIFMNILPLLIDIATNMITNRLVNSYLSFH